MKLASLLLHIAIAASVAAVLSFLTGHAALVAFSFAALVSLGAIAAQDYSPRAALVATAPTRVDAHRRTAPLRLAA